MNSQPFTGVSAKLGVALGIVLGALVAGCATEGAKPDDMSAAAHREQAARDAQQARAHDDRYPLCQHA
jgi:hypothetical protein